MIEDVQTSTTKTKHKYTKHNNKTHIHVLYIYKDLQLMKISYFLKLLQCIPLSNFALKCGPSVNSLSFLFTTYIPPPHYKPISYFGKSIVILNNIYIPLICIT